MEQLETESTDRIMLIFSTLMTWNSFIPLCSEAVWQIFHQRALRVAAELHIHCPLVYWIRSTALPLKWKLISHLCHPWFQCLRLPWGHCYWQDCHQPEWCVLPEPTTVQPLGHSYYLICCVVSFQKCQQLHFELEQGTRAAGKSGRQE